MQFFKIILLIFAFLVPATSGGQESRSTSSPADADISFQRLEQEIARAAKIIEGTVGVGAVHIESGKRISFNSRERFPMASTYKIPIAVQILGLADAGKLSLDQMIEIRERDLRPGSGMLTTYLSKPGVILSIRNLLELMLLISDNSATDILLGLAGGPLAVTARMRSLGIADMEISRPTVQMIAEANGYTLPPENEWNPELFKKLYQGTTAESRKEAARRFQRDLRDTTTPDAMVALMEKVYKGETLNQESRAMLLDILERSQTGKTRIKGFLLPETVVAHKTGSIAGTASDVGIITLPENAGHVAMAVYVKGTEKDASERDRTIAQISRSIYDFFLFRPPEGRMIQGK
jgi:beta-lactamase class A